MESFCSVPLAEGTLLTHAEENRLISLAVNHTKGASPALPLFVCIHSASTQAACQRAVEVQHLGASGLLILTPPYVRPTQEGLYRHFAAILQATPLPVFIYNNPGRTGCHLELETLKRLTSFSHLVGIKDCSGNLSHVTACAEYMRKHHPQFSLMSGDDAYTLPLMALGARGLFSVASNLFPHTLNRLVSLCLKDNFSEARLLHDQLLPLFQALSLEPNPIPIKEAMEFLKLPSGGCRLPLSSLQERNRAQLHTALNDTLAYFKEFEDV